MLKFFQKSKLSLLCVTGSLFLQGFIALSAMEDRELEGSLFFPRPIKQGPMSCGFLEK